MSNENKTVIKKQGLSFSSLLTIIFIVLKLIGVIEWSWLWVLSPLWISVVLSLAIYLIGMLIVGIIAIIKLKD